MSLTALVRWLRWRWSAQLKRLLASSLVPAFLLLKWLLRLLSRNARPSNGAVDRILVVRLDAVGDVLLSEPAIAALRRRYPTAQLHAIVGPQSRDILAWNPHLDHLWVYRAPWHAAWWGQRIQWRRELAQLWAILRQLRSQRYDLGIELRGDPRDIIFTVLAGPRTVIGSGIRGGGLLLDRRGPDRTGQHRVHFNLAIAAAAGADPTPHAPQLHLLPEVRQRVQRWTEGPGELIALHLGAGFESKQLPIETFVEVARLLYERGEQRVIVLIGGPNERALAERFKELYTGPVIDAVGKTSLQETAAILERCRLFIGNDSGPMHLAAAVGTPVVACFGPSLPSEYGPFAVPHRIVETELWCRPCDHVHCVQPEERKYLCMTSIQAAQVVRAAQELLEATQVPEGQTGRRSSL